MLGLLGILSILLVSLSGMMGIWVMYQRSVRAYEGWLNAQNAAYSGVAWIKAFGETSPVMSNSFSSGLQVIESPGRLLIWPDGTQTKVIRTPTFFYSVGQSFQPKGVTVFKIAYTLDKTGILHLSTVSKFY